MFATKEEHKIAELADVLGCSYGEAERVYHKPAPKPKETKVKALPYQKVVSMAKRAGKEYLMDNPEGSIEDAVYDIADCLLYDQQVLNAMYNRYKRVHGMTPDKQIIREILADYVAEGANR